MKAKLNLWLSFCLFFRNAVIGVVSFSGIGKACGNTPDVYARITPQAKLWIKSIATGVMDTKCEWSPRHPKVIYYFIYCFVATRDATLIRCNKCLLPACASNPRDLCWPRGCQGGRATLPGDTQPLGNDIGGEGTHGVMCGQLGTHIITLRLAFLRVSGILQKMSKFLSPRLS